MVQKSGDQHRGMCKTLANDGINYQPQLVSRVFPSTVLTAMVANHSLNGDRKSPICGATWAPNGMFLAIYMGVILTTGSNSDDLQVQTQNTKPHEAFECLGLPSSACTREMFAS